MSKPAVLISCTGNSCRSPLAEDILRAVAGNMIEVHSAGSKPAGCLPAPGIQVMKEIGSDISAPRSKHKNEFLSNEIETVIAVCSHANEAGPIFHGQLNRHHWAIDNPAGHRNG